MARDSLHLAYQLVRVTCLLFANSPQEMKERLHEHTDTFSTVFTAKRQDARQHPSFYPHMPTGKVWIYRLVTVVFCVCLYGYGFLHRG